MRKIPVVIKTLSCWWPFGFRTHNITHRFRTLTTQHNTTQHTQHTSVVKKIAKTVKIFHDLIAKTIWKCSRTTQCEFHSIALFAHHHQAAASGPSWKRITVFFHCIFSCKCLTGLNHVRFSPDDAYAQRSFLMGANCNGEKRCWLSVAWDLAKLCSSTSECFLQKLVV